MKVDVIGAGISGLWQAVTLGRRGHTVRLIERNRDSGSLSSAAASWFAGGMLAPFCEEEAAEPVVRQLGLRGIELWKEVFPGVIGNGSLVLVLRRDRAELDRFERMTRQHRRLGEAEIGELEPALAGRFANGLYFADEAHLSPRVALDFLHREAERAGVIVWCADGAGSQLERSRPERPDQSPDQSPNQSPDQRQDRHKKEQFAGQARPQVWRPCLEPTQGRALQSGDSRIVDGAHTGAAATLPPDRLATGRSPGRPAIASLSPDWSPDWTIDCRGMGAGADLAALDGLAGLPDPARQRSAKLRGVRGEMAIIRSHEIELSRPVRLLHPRFPLYVVPWGGGNFMVGATVLERSDAGPVTVRGALDLLGTAYAMHPAFGEAEILELSAGVRPAFADNVPKVVVGERRLYVNGMYRHGYLTAPVFAEIVAAIVEADGELEHVVAGGPWEGVVEDFRQRGGYGDASARSG